MARRKSKKDQSDTLVDLVEAREHAQDFVDRNQNLIFGALAAVVLIAGGIFAYNNFFKSRRKRWARCGRPSSSSSKTLLRWP